MTEYPLTLKWKVQGGGGPDAVKRRRNKAIKCAHKHSVDVISIVPAANGATWVVDGTADNVRSMIAEWAGFDNVDVSGGP